MEFKLVAIPASYTPGSILTGTGSSFALLVRRANGAPWELVPTTIFAALSDEEKQAFRGER